MQNQFHIYSREYPDSRQLIAVEFSQLPASFRSRSRDELMAHLSKLKVYQDAVVNKMVQDSVRDQNKYFSSFNNIQRISDQGSSYLNKVSEVRSNIQKLKSGMVSKNLQVINAFNQ